MPHNYKPADILTKTKTDVGPQMGLSGLIASRNTTSALDLASERDHPESRVNEKRRISTERRERTEIKIIMNEDRKWKKAKRNRTMENREKRWMKKE
jgi:hypothetical protein